MAIRRERDMEGGPGDPRDVDEWWAHFKPFAKRVLLPLAVTFVLLVLLAGCFTVVWQQVLRP